MMCVNVACIYHDTCVEVIGQNARIYMQGSNSKWHLLLSIDSDLTSLELFKNFLKMTALFYLTVFWEN